MSAALLGLVLAGGTAAVASAEEAPAAVEVWVSERMLRIRRAPEAGAERRGLMAPGAPFEVHETRAGGDCPGADWGRVGPGAWTCLADARPAEEGAEAVVLPQLIAFDAPEPAEWESYLETGRYDRAPSSEAEALVPFVYGKRWRRWKAPVWDGAEAFLSGQPASRQLGRVSKYAFVDVLETEGGTLLVRPDGAVVPADEVHVYPLDRFEGRDLLAEPLPEGRGLGWVFPYEGAPAWSGPEAEASEVLWLPYHQELELGTVQGERVEVLGVLGRSVWVDLESLRRVLPQPAPAEVEADATWLDVDLTQQVLLVMEGDTPVFATLTSTGKPRRWTTPTGLFRVMDKAAWWDMASLPDAADPYHVENVPWTVHYYPRYAEHGVFWHWGFGNPASHGCVNLGPRDARRVFELVGPELHPGWLMALETPEDPGTLIRVRAGEELEVRDRRFPLD